MDFCSSFPNVAFSVFIDWHMEYNNKDETNPATDLRILNENSVPKEKHLLKISLIIYVRKCKKECITYFFKRKKA